MAEHYITVPIDKRCILVLTRAEWQRGIRRGKATRRRQQLEARQKTKSLNCEQHDTR